ncbi:MAG TPA: 50S ribosomal protein L11 methyltransferase [Smithella sp.]|nr:50S ribosomal protein L11 methyltransferase [Smithella sp.]MDM7987355.1 50S ribosomal protein L11 methyltransferase [Smithella sp.]HNY49744.1 50S ribosomal protein L11 methyltransferase [Smithella sp.]HOG90822.1 50S ribosomal protein L11 methyltransferase [Smithella sp.]HOU51617.1 50S ribosomal protein L11 methyltransferase [Smithella sp.]
MTEKETVKWLKVEILAHPELMDALGNFLTESGAQGVFQESLAPQQTEGDFPEPTDEDILKAYFPHDNRNEKRLAALQKYINSLAEIFPNFAKPSFTTETICDPDWGEQWKKYFMPVRVSNNIVIKPTWERYTPASRDIVIEIDPGMAFGTGQHPSTRMCIEAIEDIIMNDRSIKEWKVMDVGCGTGILGITAAKMGAQDVICIDTDRKAVEIAGENATINNVRTSLRIMNKNATAIDKPRNLIIANLTANLLITLRPHLEDLLLPEGYLIISGIIEQDAKRIEKEFIADPLSLHRMITEKEWVCYVLRRNP